MNDHAHPGRFCNALESETRIAPSDELPLQPSEANFDPDPLSAPLNSSF
jgi:hypothetical protein